VVRQGRPVRRRPADGEPARPRQAGEQVEQVPRVEGVRFAGVVDGDDGTPPLVEAAAQSLPEVVRSDPVFGDRLVAEAVQHGPIERERARRLSRIDVDEPR
jgi:hypothetical protein